MDLRTRIAAGLLALGTWAGVAHAEDYPFPTLIFQPKHVRTNVATPHTWEQSGYAQEVSIMSAPSYSERYSGGYVGGGRAHGGQGPCMHQGTWGWDYTPCYRWSNRIFLNWSNGRSYQGGTRGYATDAPISIHKIKEHFSRE